MISLVLPTYNEAESIGPCVSAVCAALGEREFEIIIADDNSPDRTWEVAEQLQNDNVRVLRRMTDPGLSAAVVDAFSIAQGSVLAVMDADMQHDEKILPQLVAALETHEFAIGSRGVAGGSYGNFTPWRRFLSWGAATLAQILLSIPIRDPMAGYMVVRRDVFERAKPNLNPRGFKIMLEIFYLAKPKSFVEIGYTFRDRTAGESKLSSGVMLAYLRSLLDLRFRKTGPVKDEDS